MDTKYKIYQSKLNEEKPLTQYHEKMTSQNRTQGRSRSSQRRRNQKFYQEYNNMSRQQQNEVDNSAGLILFVVIIIIVGIALLIGGADGAIGTLKHIAR